MGASVSNSSTTAINSTVEQIKGKCSAKQNSDQNQTNNIDYKKGCRGLDINITQSQQQIFECSIDQGAQAANSAVQQATTAAKAGIGFAVSNSTEDVENSVKEALTAICSGSQNVNQTQLNNIACSTDLTSSSGQIDILNITQIGTSKTKCIMGQIASAVNQATQKNTTTSSGMDLDFLLGPIIAIIVIIVVIVIVVLVIKAVFKAGGAAVGAATGGGQSGVTMVPMAGAVPGAPGVPDATGAAGAGLPAAGSVGGSAPGNVTTMVAPLPTATVAPTNGVVAALPAGAPGGAPGSAVVYQNAGGLMRRVAGLAAPPRYYGGARRYRGM
jgi:hypothetical protein